MESISEIWKSARERFSNPFVFSFLISWFAVNWKIPVGLFWLDSYQVERLGYLSIFDLVASEASDEASLWLPLVLAIAYCLVVPVIKQLLSMFNTLLDRIGTSANLSISQTGKVAVSKYLVLLEEYNTKGKALEHLWAAETQRDKNFQELQSKYKDLELKLTESIGANTDLQTVLVKEQDVISKMRDIRILNGKWIVRKDTQTGQVKQEVSIESGRLIVDGHTNSEFEDSTLIAFFFDARNKAAVFTRLPSGDVRPRHFTNQVTIENSDYMTGNENGYPIAFERVRQ